MIILSRQTVTVGNRSYYFAFPVEKLLYILASDYKHLMPIINVHMSLAKASFLHPVMGLHYSQNKSKDSGKLFCCVKSKFRASLVAQRERIHPLMQETQVWSLVQGDLTWRAVVKPMSHNYWAYAIEPRSHNYSEATCLNSWSPHAWSPCSTAREATAVSSLHTAARQKARQQAGRQKARQQRRPSTSKNKVNSVSAQDTRHRW